MTAPGSAISVTVKKDLHSIDTTDVIRRFPG